MKVPEANVGKMETQLQQWGAKLDELVAQVEATGTEAKLDYRERIDDLKAKHQLARSQLHELKAAGSGKWETLKTGMEGAWNELEVALKKLTSSPEGRGPSASSSRKRLVSHHRPIRSSRRWRQTTRFSYSGWKNHECDS
jgi:hypothetical protein